MEKARKKIKLCPTCEGAGGTWHQTEYPRHGSDQGKSDWVICPICEGSGRVIINKEISIKPFIPNNHAVSEKVRHDELKNALGKIRKEIHKNAIDGMY